MNVFEFANGFELNNNFAFDQEVQAMFADLMIAIEKRNGVLPNELNPAKGEFNC